MEFTRPTMREALELRTTALMDSLSDVSNSTLLQVSDSLSEIVDEAERLEFQVLESAAPVSVSMVRDMLNECLSNALTPFTSTKPVKAGRKAKTARRNTAARNAKTRVKARTAQRKLKRGAR